MFEEIFRSYSLAFPESSATRSRMRPSVVLAANARPCPFLRRVSTARVNCPALRLSGLRRVQELLSG